MNKRFKFGLAIFAMLVMATNAIFADKNSDLIAAAYDGDKATVEKLLDEGASIDAKDKEGRTALYRASGGGHKDIVELLLEKGAYIEAKQKEDATPLYVASQNGHNDVVALLLAKGADIEAKEKDGWTALMVASQEGHKDVVELLLENGADIEAKEKDGWTALMAASSNGHKDVVELLLLNGAEVNARAWDGTTALCAASYNGGHKDIAKLLLENDAEAKPTLINSWGYELGKNFWITITGTIQNYAPAEAKNLEYRVYLTDSLYSGTGSINGHLYYKKKCKNLKPGASINIKDKGSRIIPPQDGNYYITLVLYQNDEVVDYLTWGNGNKVAIHDKSTQQAMISKAKSSIEDDRKYLAALAAELEREEAQKRAEAEAKAKAEEEARARAQAQANANTQTTTTTTTTVITHKTVGGNGKLPGSTGYQKKTDNNSTKKQNTTQNNSQPQKTKCTACKGTGHCSLSHCAFGDCTSCGGRGYNRLMSGKMILCSVCNASGKCSTCFGSGKCKWCKGTGYED